MHKNNTKNDGSLCCLYIDVNGLHELNNTLGHAAGAAMLIYLGNSLKLLFEHQDSKMMIATAESRMYEDKRRYYEASEDVSKARVINQKLDRILLEKKDADAFLDIISARFMGVYIVNMDYDQIRRMLEEEKEMKFHYQKKDGIKLILRICMAEHYDTAQSYTIWIFEKNAD